jgi:signal peptidase I
MAPTFRPGDALIVVPAKVKELHLGEIISYQSVKDSRVIISHRLIGVDSKTGWLTTSGDALRTTDKPIPPTQLVGRATAVAPHLGLLIDFLRHPIGLALIVYLPALAVIIAEIRRLAINYKPFPIPSV